MKHLFILILFIGLSSFTLITEASVDNTLTTLHVDNEIYASFSLINDTKEKVSIHTGSGFVSLNKGSKTSITCKIGKEIRWANKGKKGDVIFKIQDKHCSKTVKLSSEL